MNRGFLAALLAVSCAACEQQPSEPVKKATTARSATSRAPTGRLQRLVTANAAMVGYIASPEQPAILASFGNDLLQWRSDPKGSSMVQGRADVFSYPDRVCVGFEQKNLFMPTHGPERYLICEATEPIKHSNFLPRTQDFSFAPGALFMQYEPPRGTGFPQIFYIAVEK
jgi:hypothetical protein